MPLELRRYSDLARYIKEPQNGIYCLNLEKWQHFKAETLFHTRSNLLCLVCRHIVSVLFAPHCIFHCVRTWCVVWDVATVTKGGGSLRGVNSEEEISKLRDRKSELQERKAEFWVYISQFWKKENWEIKSRYLKGYFTPKKNFVINYSPLCHSKPVRPSFIFGKNTNYDVFDEIRKLSDPPIDSNVTETFPDPET